MGREAGHVELVGELSGPEWPDWEVKLDRADRPATERALRNLARYANPALVDGLGLGRGGASPVTRGVRYNSLSRLRDLADGLIGLRIAWTTDPFNPRSGHSQVIRTAEELLEGQGTCLDFAVSLAALCIRHVEPVTLAVAVAEDQPASAHAFVIAERLREPGTGPARDPAGAGDDAYQAHRFADWVRAFRQGTRRAEHYLIDVTPPALEEAGRTGQAETATDRSNRTVEWLKTHQGTVYTVAVVPAVRKAGDYYRLPSRRRDLGITASLPDPPPDLRNFPSHSQISARLGEAGAAGNKRNVLLLGPQGSGKSTLALARAVTASGGRGWFIDGSGRSTFLRSLASAEARSRGAYGGNEQKEFLSTMSVRALHRLASTSRPWVVIVDNAEGPPGEIADLLPNPEPGQILIVTTTREDWLDHVDPQSWEVLRVPWLGSRDLGAGEEKLGLAESELLPGMLRMAHGCDPEALAASAALPPGPGRLVRALLGWTDGGDAPPPTGGLAELAAACAFMPAEGITVGWLADAVYGGDRDAARAGVAEAARRGLLEHGRRSLGARDHDEMPLWMHRSIGSAVRELTAENGLDVRLRVLAANRAAHRPYSPVELDMLAAFLAGVPGARRSHLYARAAVSVMDLLEPRGGEAVAKAAQLGALAESCVDPAADDAAELKCLILMAMARPVNHSRSPSLTDIADGIALCLAAESAVDGRPGREYRLLYGRAQAMHGILLKKKAGRLPDGAVNPTRLELLDEAIDILRISYKERRAALTEHGELIADPDHHVDRGWYNLGGAYINVANEIVWTQPEMLTAVLNAALEAYAGSLNLRRSVNYHAGHNEGADSETMYTAASLWGVALVLYTAALHCPGDLGMANIARVEELDPVRQDQTRESLLRAAELTVTRSLDIRAIFDGPLGRDTGKSRDLLRKIAIAWETPSRDAGQRRAELLAALAPFRKDVGIGRLCVAAAAEHCDV